MNRRLKLLLVSFGTLLVVFCIYHWSSGGCAKSRRTLVDPRPMRQNPPQRLGAGPGIGDGERLRIESRDDNGRLQGVYEAEHWVRQKDGSIKLVQPRMMMHLRNGQRVYISGSDGVVHADEIARGGFNPRRGILTDNVRIFLDRAPAAVGRSPEQWRQDVVRIYVDNIEFNNDDLSFITDGPLTIFSAEADICGKGLVLLMNSQPQELRELRIKRGDYMAIHKVPEGMDPMLPGTQAPPEKPGSAAKRKSAAGGSDKIVVAVAPSVATLPLPSTVQSQPLPAPRATEPAVVQSIVGATPVTKPVKPLRRNVYQLDLNDDVRVDNGPRRMDGTKRLSLVFDWEDTSPTGTKPDNAASAPTPPENPGAASAPVASAPAVDAGTNGQAVAAIQDNIKAVTGNPATQAAADEEARKAVDARTTRPTSAPGREPMIITWKGPLVLRPIGRTETPSSKQYDVIGEGDQMTLADAQGTATCRKFTFSNPGQRGQLIGSPQAKAHLTMANGEQIEADTISFDRVAGAATLNGSGYMDRLSDKAAAPAASMPSPTDRIIWNQGVDVKFASEAGPGGKRVEVIREAFFHGNVELTQALSGDFLKCDDLQVWMTRGRDGKPYPGRAVATGRCLARMTGRPSEPSATSGGLSCISADKVEVLFAEASNAGKTARGSQPAPAFVQADGNVIVSDQRGTEPVEARADHMSSDLIRRNAILTGNPAMVGQGESKLFGTDIRMDEAGQTETPEGPREQTVVVNGKGRLQFITQKDMDNRKLEQPRPVNVSWTKSMEYSSDRNVAEFEGDVDLLSQDTTLGKAGQETGQYSLKAQHLRMLFENSPADKAVAKAPRSPGPAGIGMDVGQYGQRRISMVLADNNAVLASQRHDVQGRLWQRMHLSGPRVIFDLHNTAAANKDKSSGTVNVIGSGKMLLEDYRPPEGKSATSAMGDMGTSVERPSQTAFQWKKTMQMSQADRTVDMNGDVHMVHRSGDQVVLSDKLNAPPWGTLSRGRSSILACDKLIAQFSEPDQKAAKAAPSGDLVGPRVGPMERFIATKNVNLQDGSNQMLGQRLIYERVKDVVILWGYLEGDAPANAQIISDDKSTLSPKIIFNPKTQRIRTERVAGSGSR